MSYFVIPDIHGNNVLLQQALAEIYSRQEGGKIIFLGDYIDRGDDNKGVIETVMNPPENWEFVCIKGNHEEMFVDSMVQGYSLYDPNVLDEWVDSDTPLDSTVPGSTAKRMNFPYEILEWMDKLIPFHIEDVNIFAHAYYDPHQAPEHQDPHRCCWVRMPDARAFFSDTYHLTHGHTPRDTGPTLAVNRTNLDCRAFGPGAQLVVGVYENNVKGPVEFIRFGG